MSRAPIRLHDYVVRTRRIEVLETEDDLHLCRVPRGREEYLLNSSALAVLNLCDGRSTVCGMLLQLQAGLALDASEMEEVRSNVEETLVDLASRGWVEARATMDAAPGIVACEDHWTRLHHRRFPGSIQVINLDYRTDRWETFSRALEAAGVPGYRRLPAVNAEDYGTVEDMLADFGYRLHPSYHDVRGFDSTNHRFKAKTGCALSHITALRNIVATGRKGWHLIFEDDDTPLQSWDCLVDSLADTLDRCRREPDMIILSDRVGTASPCTGIKDRWGADAYAVRLSICDTLIESLDFTSGGFHLDYSLDNHYYHLCRHGRLNTAVLANGAWATCNTRRDSDIER